jgi:2-keto-4-pentenoate hydratase/2-oxohepta-3-ene-1,7-dioic acid hydratase in catechol pathway
MRIVRIDTGDGAAACGIVEGDSIRLASGDPLRGLQPTGERRPLAGAKLLAPIVPVNILAIGRNYRAHAEEQGADLPKAPMAFMKATSSVIGPDAPVRLPAPAPAEVDYEAELAVVIGRTARRVPAGEALRHVLGYTCANDVSARDCQRADGQWVRAKSFDTFCPLGPWIETDLDPRDLAIRCRVGGQTMQDARTSQMIFGIPFLIAYLSAGMTLLPGTVLLTGTPSGVGSARRPPRFLQPGDTVEVEIEGLGTLRNPVAAE